MMSVSPYFRIWNCLLIGLFSSVASSQPIPTLTRCEAISEFTIPQPGAFLNAIVAGPDGNLWFSGYPGIGLITPTGVVTLIPIAGNPGTRALAFDLEGNLWFAEELKIGRLSAGGLIAEFTLPAGGRPAGIALGPDNEIWFTDSWNQRVGRISPDGSFSEIQLSAYPGAITAGPDGNLWFTESGDRIARSTPTGDITEFVISGDPNSFAVAISAGPDGALWFAESYGALGRITTAGVLTLFPIPRFQLGETLGGIASGPDGNIWFTEYVTPFPYSSATPFGKIGRATLLGEISQYSLPTSVSAPTGITAGPDGNLWVTESYVNKIARIPVRPCSRSTIDLFPRGGIEPR